MFLWNGFRHLGQTLFHSNNTVNTSQANCWYFHTALQCQSPVLPGAGNFVMARLFCLSCLRGEALETQSWSQFCWWLPGQSGHTDPDGYRYSLFWQRQPMQTWCQDQELGKQGTIIMYFTSHLYICTLQKLYWRYWYWYWLSKDMCFILSQRIALDINIDIISLIFWFTISSIYFLK